jgi:hypothetical protein
VLCKRGIADALLMPWSTLTYLLCLSITSHHTAHVPVAHPLSQKPVAIKSAIGNQLHQRCGPVLDEDRLHGLAPQAACAGCSVYELQASVNESLWQGGCGVS